MKNNFFLYSIIIFSFASIIFSSVAFADVISPKKQLQAQISVEDVICSDGYVKIIKITNGNPSCVKPSSAEKLIKQGWANPVDSKIISEAQMKKDPIGKINKLAVVQVKGTAGLQTPKLPVLGYNFVFEVCAQDQTIYVPTVFIKSDSSSQYVELASRVDANSCQTTSTIIKAANADSITATLENKGGLSEKISILESKIADLSQKLDAEKKGLSEIIKETQSNDYKTKISEANKKILQLRQELNDARADYSRFLFVTHSTSSKSNAPSKFSFSGQPIVGSQVNVLAITPQVTGGGYNVVFEACAGVNTIRAPLVTVQSDIDSKEVVLANRISPNSCQIGTGQLTANDEKSIQIILDNTEEFSAKISELENQIASWQADQAAAKRSLAELVNKAQKPDDYNDQVNNLTSMIVDLRNLINGAKSMLHGSLFAFYA